MYIPKSQKMQTNIRKKWSHHEYVNYVTLKILGHILPNCFIHESHLRYEDDEREKYTLSKIKAGQIVWQLYPASSPNHIARGVFLCH